MKKFMEKLLAGKNVIYAIAAMLIIAITVFLFDKDGVGKTGWEVIADRPGPVFLIFVGAVIVYFAIKYLVKKYQKDGVDEGGIHYGLLIIAFAYSLTFLSTCDAKADSTVPRTPVDTIHRQAAGEMVAPK